MGAIFISYARENETAAALVADSLRAAGFDVWRDDQLPAHRAYGDVIQERLHSASAVVVLWSAEAARSQWVRSEADHARTNDKLVQARLDDCRLPLPFDQIQCADLSGWAGEPLSAWDRLIASVTELAGVPPVAATRARRAGCSICVLPFQNMSGDAEQEYFSDGISEDITTDLSKVSALAVTARNTAFQFKGKAVDVCEVASKLGVSHVLEGSVRKAGARVRITAQLIDGASGDHVWAERYDRDLDDIFAIQDELSKAIVDALKIKLLPEEKKAIGNRDTSNADAYNLYLMARNTWITGNHGDRRRDDMVVRFCQRALEIDPTYARAWALLAIAQSNLRFGFGLRGPDGVESANRALELDPTIAEAYCVTTRSLMEAARYEEAAEEIGKGLALDPESWELNKAAGFLFFRQGRFPESADFYEKAVAVMDTDFHGWGMLASCYRGMKDPRVEDVSRKIIEECERVTAQDPNNGAAISFAVGAFAELGDAERAKAWIERALLIDPDNLNMRYNFACALSILGEREAALEMLENSLRRARGSLVMAELDPDFENIRDDPRFRKIIAIAKASAAKAQAEAAEPLIPPAASAPLRS